MDGDKSRLPATKPLPRQQERVLGFIRAEIAANRDFPTKRMIADHMGWNSEAGPSDVLNALDGKGYITRRHAKGNGWIYSLPGGGDQT